MRARGLRDGISTKAHTLLGSYTTALSYIAWLVNRSCASASAPASRSALGFRNGAANVAGYGEHSVAVRSTHDNLQVLMKASLVVTRSSGRFATRPIG
jgi:hypothetical protein